jgi:acyl-CoA dehydrogenase
MFIMKLAYARHWAATMETAMQVVGAEAMLTSEPSNVWGQYFLSQYAIRLGGGTDEVQANIIAEQGLGLPREPSNDRDVPWKDLARS